MVRNKTVLKFSGYSIFALLITKPSINQFVWCNKLLSICFSRTPNIGYDFKTNSGNAFNYFVYGAGCSEVEIDCLTGDHLVNRGSSLSPHECPS